MEYVLVGYEHRAYNATCLFYISLCIVWVGVRISYCFVALSVRFVTQIILVLAFPPTWFVRLGSNIKQQQSL